MNANKRFDVRLSPEAAKEYNSLDNSVLDIVDPAIDDLVFRADVVGTALRNNSNTKLAGCKEKKLRSAGIRIVFKVTNQRVDVLRIVYILAIEKRANDLVFKNANNRNIKLGKLPKGKLVKHYNICTTWHSGHKHND